MPPLVSVVIPSFNRGTLLEGAVRSVLEQTHQDLEVIVIDDGSTDDTVNVLVGLAEKDERIHSLHLDSRRGAQAARNSGIRAAQGRWIAFLDSDDRWLPDSLEARLELARRANAHVVHSDCRVVERGDIDARRFGVPPMEGRVFKELLRGPGPVFPSLLVSKEALTRIGYLDEGITSYQEWDTTIRLAEHYEFAFVPRPTFIYDRRQEDTISRDLLRTAVGYEQVFQKHRWAVLRHLGPKALAFHYQTVAAQFRLAGDPRKARRCLLFAIFLWPFRPGALVRRARRFLGLALQRSA
jgi:glycosyltransferase involved in cell wall biosynthesis